MRGFRNSNKTTIYCTIYKEQPCIWCRNQIQGCFDILLLKVDLHTVFLQPSDGGQRVHRIPCEAGYRLGDDQVHLNVVFDTK